MLGDSPVTPFVSTADPDKARAFYRDTLGLKLVSESIYALVFDAAGRELRVSIVEELTPHGYTVLGWTVGNIRQTVLALRERGVTFERFADMKQDAFGIWRGPRGAQVAWFKDPDGNVLSLTEPSLT
jgi:catechol 2,3-dioxygenase-like lactoylglutathione lyase family enzyme